MRLLLALSCVACTATPTEPVRRSADLTIAWDSTLAAPKKPAGYIPCAMRPDTSVIVIDGVKYLEIVEHCE